MTNNMISIIIPYKNAAEWLPRCLESCEKANDNVEFIFVDDNDSDREWDIVADYPEVRVVHRMGLNEGVSVARNYGMHNAHGDWITFLDADDLINPDAYEQIAKSIADADGFPFIQLNHIRQRPNGTQYMKRPNARGLRKPDNLPFSFPAVWNKVIRADLINDIRFIEGMQYGEDELFCFECLAKAGGVYCADRVAMTHCNDNPKSLSRTRSREDLKREQQELIAFLDRHEDKPEICQAVCKRLSDLWINPIYLNVFGGKK